MRSIYIKVKKYLKNIPHYLPKTPKLGKNIDIKTDKDSKMIL